MRARRPSNKVRKTLLLSRPCRHRHLHAAFHGDKLAHEPIHVAAATTLESLSTPSVKELSVAAKVYAYPCNWHVSLAVLPRWLLSSRLHIDKYCTR